MTRGKASVAISGVSGRFPSADSLAEFEYHLYNGLDMVTDDDTRWPQGKDQLFLLLLVHLVYST